LVLKELKSKTPEFFYNSMAKVTDNDMMAAIAFSSALDELFN
jgi:hypothetical protein